METNKPHTALLVMDVQMQILERLPDNHIYAGTVAQAIEKARKGGLPVIYVGLSFRPGFPDVSTNNKMFALTTQSPMATAIIRAPDFPEAITPKEGDVIVIKKRISAFTGSDLEVVLRSMHITHLVLAGISTGGIVLSTLREAADKDYKLTVLSDGCIDMDAEVHQVLLNKVFPRQATVVTIGEWDVNA